MARLGRQRRRRFGERRPRVSSAARGPRLAGRLVAPRARRADRPTSGRGRPARRSTSSCSIRSACRPASTAATRSSSCSPTGSTGTRIRTSRRSAASQVSAHFLIRRDGELLQFVSCDERAWHAGASRWRGRDELQRLLDRHRARRAGRRAVRDAQYATLAALLRSAGAALSDRRSRRPRARRAGPQDRSRRRLRLAAAARALAPAGEAAFRSLIGSVAQERLSRTRAGARIGDNRFVTNLRR